MARAFPPVCLEQPTSAYTRTMLLPPGLTSKQRRGEGGEGGMQSLADKSGLTFWWYSPVFPFAQLCASAFEPDSVFSTTCLRISLPALRIQEHTGKMPVSLRAFGLSFSALT